jgi:tetratricopeptide (TPR) repeat protein
MSENSPAAAPQGGDNFKNRVAVLIALVTTLIAGVTYLQADASARDNRANRDTKRYAMEIMGQKIAGEVEANFAYYRAYLGYHELDLLAASAANTDDTAAAARYESLRDSQTRLSPLMAPPYFDATTSDLKLAKYEADVYVIKTAALQERFSAAQAVKDAWDAKANSYILHLTLLAVALFLFGMSVTVAGTVTRWIFSGTGAGVALVAGIWMVMVWAQPVKDLRDCKIADGTAAIDAYAQGVGLAYQDDFMGAVAQFDQALACEPNFINARVERAGAKDSLGLYEAAADDYVKAYTLGDKRALVTGEAAWAYYRLGRFEDAIRWSKIALAGEQKELWIQFDLAVSLLANGQTDAAAAEYERGMAEAAKMVAEAKAAGEEPPSDVWWSLEDAAVSLDNLALALDGSQTEPPSKAIVGPDQVSAFVAAWTPKLKSQSVALEFTGRPPEGQLTATASAFEFTRPIHNEAGEVVDYEAADGFAYGTDEVGVQFDYAGLQDGQDYLFKVYVDGEEDPSWRTLGKWELGASGSAEFPLSVAYSTVQVLDPGEYTVELYINSHLAQRGVFVIDAAP